MFETIRVERQGAIATLQMRRPPVNALDGTLCRELLAAIVELEADPAVQGLIVAGSPGVFCAGLDVRALYPLERPAMRAFWFGFCELFRAIAGTPLVTVAAIAGHAPAGGCVLALSCDHRIMVEGAFKIGLNEVEVGLPVPRWLAEWAISVLGRRQAERMLQLGALVEPAEALQVGLVDAVVPCEGLVDAARAELAKRLALPPHARRATKHALRAATLRAMEQAVEADTEAFLDGWFGPECRAVMGALVARLSGRR